MYFQRGECCIHCVTTTENLTTLQSQKTRETLQFAAEIRDHKFNTVLDNTTKLPLLKYHRMCYQRFTMKNDLNKIQNKKKETTEAVDRAVSSPIDFMNERQADTSTILPKECIFCKKRKTKNKSTEALTLCIDNRAMTTIKTAAEKKNDYLIISIPNLIASEAHYDSSCYRQ